jgi:hypothetical protein
MPQFLRHRPQNLKWPSSLEKPWDNGYSQIKEREDKKETKERGDKKENGDLGKESIRIREIR